MFGLFDFINGGGIGGGAGGPQGGLFDWSWSKDDKKDVNPPRPQGGPGMGANNTPGPGAQMGNGGQPMTQEQRDFLREIANKRQREMSQQMGQQVAGGYMNQGMNQYRDMSQSASLPGLMNMIQGAQQMGGQQPYQDFVPPFSLMG